ncbi:ATP-grasp domain-containing protein [Massilia sp. LjRoot122]|uniref:ATP-grasp domain-containing protein n=1 Tax=Massilia sp. LjRoot122 TaxID=3342257 RepID=UPI003ECEE070
MRLLILEQHRSPENEIFETVARERSINVETIDPVRLCFDGNLLVDDRGSTLELNYDAIAIRSYRRFSLVKQAARQFANAGKPVYGLNVEHHAFTQDKFSDILDLHAAGVPVPLTASLPTGISGHLPGAGIVAKENWGFGGAGVSLIGEASVGPEQLYNLHFQEFLPAQEDWRVLVCEGRALPWVIVREPTPGDFRTNTHQGGIPTVCHASMLPDLYKELSTVAETAANVLGRPCAGVDLRQGRNGPVVLEVNRTPRLRLGEHTSSIVGRYLDAWINGCEASGPT